MELYKSLLQFRDSNLNPIFVKEADDDRIVKVKRVNETNRGKSLVELRFTEEEYMNIFVDDKDNHNNNASIIAACESRYSGNLFVDTYWGDDEMRQGYTLSYFNEENITLFRKILKLTILMNSILFFYLLSIVLNWLTGNSPFNGFATLVVINIISFTMVMTLLALIGILCSNILVESKSRPAFLVSKKTDNFV